MPESGVANFRLDSLKGHISLVTGASMGIGRAICEKLASEGSDLILNYSSKADKASYGISDAMEGTVASIRSFGVKYLVYDVDVSNRNEVQSMTSDAKKKLGDITILVNNAGVHSGKKSIIETSEQLYDYLLGVNLKGQFLMCQAVLPGMISKRAGNIVNISSELALTAVADHVAYTAAKTGILGLTRSLAKEVAPYGILVNCVCPGPVDTNALDAHERTQEYIKTIALSRLGKPKDISSLVYFLVSPENTWTTGQVISPNGGIVI